MLLQLGARQVVLAIVLLLTLPAAAAGRLRPPSARSRGDHALLQDDINGRVCGARYVYQVRPGGAAQLCDGM